MSFISYFSSSFTTIKDDDCWICSIKESVAAFRIKDVWKILCIFIDDDKFSWQAFFSIFKILYDSIHLWSSFLNDRFVLMFLMNSHIISFIWYSSERFFFWFAYFFCMFCAFVNFFLMKSQIFFIFSVIVFAFWVNIRSFTDNRSVVSMSTKSKLIRDSYS